MSMALARRKAILVMLDCFETRPLRKWILVLCLLVLTKQMTLTVTVRLKISHASAVMRSLKLPASKSDRTEEHTASCKYSK
jgi:hypothetical protein